jgi:hypothetical protein
MKMLESSQIRIELGSNFERAILPKKTWVLLG